MTEQVERDVEVSNRQGLHARPAAEFVKVASRFDSEIFVETDDLEVNGKSIMGVMMLAAEPGTTLVIRADGEDSGEAVDALAELVEGGFAGTGGEDGEGSSPGEETGSGTDAGTGEDAT